jgi:hypothetical protein
MMIPTAGKPTPYFLIAYRNETVHVTELFTMEPSNIVNFLGGGIWPVLFLAPNIMITLMLDMFTILTVCNSMNTV